MQLLAHNVKNVTSTFRFGLLSVDVDHLIYKSAGKTDTSTDFTAKCHDISEIEHAADDRDAPLDIVEDAVGYLREMTKPI